MLGSRQRADVSGRGPPHCGSGPGRGRGSFGSVPHNEAPACLCAPPRFRVTPSLVTQAWYGSAELWTALDKDGETWHGLPRSSDGSFGQKTFWWSESFSVGAEPEPAISVEGRRLDRVGPTFHAGDPGTNAMFDGMSSMLVGVDVPTSGCWELTGRYRGAQLSYVVRIADR